MKITRKLLYEQVWATPIHQLAKEYGLSDVGLAKVCKRHNIPRPPRGYWAKKEAGYKAKRTPLPKPDSDETIVIHGSRTQEIPKTAGLENEKQISRMKSQPAIHVPASLRSPHPLISGTSAVLHSSKPDEFGYLSVGDRSCLNIKVTKSTLSRALRVFNTLIVSLEKRGYKVEVTKPQQKPGYFNGRARSRSKTGATILGAFVEFSISELHDTEKIQTESYGYRSIHYKYFPNGKLGLKIENEYLYDGLRKSWRDGTKQRIEDCLDAFIGGMINVAEALRQKELERERQEREWELERIRKEEERQRVEQENARIFDLNDRLNDMKTAKAIREFTRIVRSSAVKCNEDVSTASELGKWLSWAENHAELLTKNAIETILEQREDPGKRNRWGY